MLKIGEIVELNVEKLVYEGEGLARTEENVVFIPDTCTGDTIKAEITSVKKTFAKAVIKEIITPSEYRTKPFCPLANICGGCQWQHISYSEQLNAKKQIIKECIKKIAGIDIPVKDVIKSDEITEYRCKVQYPVRQTKNSKRFLAGYYQKGTHEIVNIKYCPIQPRIIDEITEFLRKKSQELKLTAYNEKKQNGLIRHFVYRYSQSNKDLLLTIVVNERRIYPSLRELCESVKNEFPAVAGVLINFNTSGSNVILGAKTELIEGNDFIEEKLDGKSFKISAESFFQVNPLAAQKMFSEVRKIIEEKTKTTLNQKPKILDIYAGSGSFSIYLSDIASTILAVEDNESSINNGEENLISNGINNISFLKGNADTVLSELAEKNEKYDAIILDPPRKGCSEAILESIKKLDAQYIVYVSCNPSTLARDIKILSDKYIPEFIQPVDMFCHTYHVESILILRKQ